MVALAGFTLRLISACCWQPSPAGRQYLRRRPVVFIAAQKPGCGFAALRAALGRWEHSLHPLPGAGQPPSAEMRCWPLLQEPGHGAAPPRRAPAGRQRRGAAQRGSRRLPERGARGGLWSSSPGTAQKRQIIICRGALRDIS